MFDELRDAVGRRMPNRKEDVELVQRWLQTWDKYFWPGSPGFSEGNLDGFTEMAIGRFQRETMKHRMPSGIVEPGDATAKKLASTPGPRPEGKILSRPPRSDFNPLSEEDYQRAADALECEARTIKAVGKVEGLDGDGFDHFNRPIILFEPTHFNQKTHHAFEKSHRELTHKDPLGLGYGSYESQWRKLNAAYFLQSKAACTATSWGKFQILGEHYGRCGYAFIEMFVSAMCISERNHLSAFVAYTKSDKWGLHAIRENNWTDLATFYNGPKYQKYDYDTRLKAAYEKFGR